MQRKLWLFITLLTLLPATALAGGSAKMQTGDTTMQVVWQDENTLRTGGEDASSYLIVRDGKAYSVSTANGQPRVMEMAGMLKMMQAMAGESQNQESRFGHVDSVEKTGASETVAGIEGRVYLITTTDPNGKTETVETVLTDNPLVVEMTRAYLGSMQAMFGGDDLGAFMDALPDDEHGLLRAGEDFRLLSIASDDPPASLFELPAEPMNLQQMMKGMGG